MHRLHDISACQHIVSGLFIEELQDPMIPENDIIISSLKWVNLKLLIGITLFSPHLASRRRHSASKLSWAHRTFDHWDCCCWTSGGDWATQLALCRGSGGPSAASPVKHLSSTIRTRSVPATYWICPAPRIPRRLPTSLAMDTGQCPRSPCAPPPGT